MRLAGLTGGIATGKSTVSSMFGALGAHIVDADRIAREVVEPGRWAWKRIVSHFGSEVLQEDRRIDRKRLGGIVFENPAERAHLNHATHPPIYLEVLRALLLARLRNPPLLILDAPLLFETPLSRITRRTIVVYADPERQLARLVDRDGLTLEEARQRVEAQMPIEEKRMRADFVIDNSGTLTWTRQQVEALWLRLAASGPAAP